MNLFLKYKAIDENSLQIIRRKFLRYYEIDLDEIYNEYISAPQDNTTQNKPSPMKISITGKSLSENNSIKTDYIKYDKHYFKYLIKYEKIIKELRKPNTYDSLQEACYHTFGLHIPSLLAKCNSIDTYEQKKYLRNYYGISLPSIDDYLKTNQELLSLKANFQKQYGLDIGNCFVSCYSSFQKHKQKILNKAANKNESHRYINNVLFEKCWDIITTKRFVSKFLSLNISHKNTTYRHVLLSHSFSGTSYNRNIIKINYELNLNQRYEHCFSGHRRDFRSDLVTVPGEMDPSVLMQVTMDDHHMKLKKKGIANFVREQLEYLSTNWNDTLKIAVLLDLYWNLKTLFDTSTTIKLTTYHKDKSDNNKDTIVPCFNQGEFSVIDTRKYKIAKEINDITERQRQGELLYPLAPSVKYASISRTFEASDSFAEIQLNFLLNPDITDFLKRILL